MTRGRLVVGFSVLLFAVLIAACVTPVPVAVQPVATPIPTTAAPVEPTATPVPPTPVADPAAPIKAWADVLNRGDVDGALAAFTDDGTYSIYYNAYDKESMRWVFNWLAGLETLQENLDCQPEDDKIACEYTVLDGCIAASGSKGLPVNAVFTLEDGKIKAASGYGTGPEWDAYWDWVRIVQSWEGAFRAEESAKIEEGTIEGGALAIKLCREYATAVETQAPATTAAAQSLVDAINNGDVDAALALVTDDAKVRILGDEATGVDELRSLVDWLAGKGTQYEITDCEWQGIGVECTMSLVDGCVTAFGASEGLPGKMRFYSLENGPLRQVAGVLTADARKAYDAWLEAKDAWASANRAEELAQVEGYTRPTGEMAVKLCQDYAAAAGAPTSATPEAEGAQPELATAEPAPVIWDDDGSIDGVTALLYFLQNPSYEVKAATISPGIAHPRIFAANLARFFALLGVEGIPIAVGPEQPLAGDNAFPEAWRAASDKFWNLELPEPAAQADDRTAAQLMVDVIKSSEQPVMIFVSGPLTNLAEALRMDPSIKDGIRSVEVMGGAIEAPGNISSSQPAEWNIFIDPVAAGEVFASGVPINLTPLDATDQVSWTEDDATAWEVAQDPASSVAAQLLRRTLSDWSSSTVLIWDLVAALNASDRELCQWEDVHIEIATDEGVTEGQTVVVGDQAANVRVCLSPDADAYREAAQEAFGKAD